jgi:CRP-like cAMP-binding protein
VGNYEPLRARLFHSRRECPPVGRLQRARCLVAPAVCGGGVADRDSFLCAPAYGLVGTACLERGLCGDQPLAILAALHRASSSQTDGREEEIRRLAFKGLPPRKVLQVLSIGSWISAEVGECLIERGKLPNAISLITRGKVRLSKDGRVLGDLKPGDLVGSALILSGIPSDVEAVTVEPVRAMHWQLGALEKYLSANPETRSIMQRHLARDLAGKIGRLVQTEGSSALS